LAARSRYLSTSHNPAYDQRAGRIGAVAQDHGDPPDQKRAPLARSKLRGRHRSGRSVPRILPRETLTLAISRLMDERGEVKGPQLKKILRPRPAPRVTNVSLFAYADHLPVRIQVAAETVSVSIRRRVPIARRIPVLRRIPGDKRVGREIAVNAVMRTRLGARHSH